MNEMGDDARTPVMTKNATEPEQADQALPTTELTDKTVRTLFDGIPDAIVAVDRSGAIALVNARVSEMFGYDAAELVGQPVEILVPDGFKAAHPNERTRYGNAPRVRSMGNGLDLSARRKDGTTFSCAISLSPLNVGGEQLVVTVVRDMTDLRAAVDSHLQLATIVESSEDAIHRVALDGTIEGWSKSAEKIYGYSAQEAIGLGLSKLVPPDRAGESDQVLDSIRQGVPLHLPDTVRLRKDGEPITVSISIHPIRDRRGKVIAAGGISRDITVQKKLEEQLRHAQRLESVGRLAAGVAHDFNNILTIILGYAGLVREELPEAEQDSPTVSALYRAIERGSTIADRLLAFARNRPHTPTIVPFSAFLFESGRVLHQVLRENIDVSVVPNSRASIKADRALLEQIFLDLALNAQDAMPRGGRLLITATDIVVETPDPRGTVCPDPIPIGPNVVLTVTDEGAGMTEEVLAKIVDPFYTTKEPGDGTGLGLAAVYGAVRQSGGAISVSSTPGKGTSFTVYFPQVLDRPSEVSLPRVGFRTPAETRGGGAILLVEDDPELCALSTDVLTARGYAVARAEDPREALEIFEKEGPFDLVVTDVVMPWLSGPEMVREMRRRKPDTRVLYISGYSEADHWIDEEHADVLEKPFAPPTLLSTVAGLLKTDVAGSPTGAPDMDGRPEDGADTLRGMEDWALPMFRAMPSGRLAFANHSLAELFGYTSPEDLITAEHEAVTNFFGAGEIPSLDSETGRANTSARGIELDLQRSDGSTRWVAVHGRAVFGEDGRRLYTEGVLLDITERRLWEQSLARTVGELNRVIRGESAHFANARFRNLSVRETEVALAILDGGRVATVATSLEVTPNTVRQHLKSIFKKLGVRSQQALIERFKFRSFGVSS